MNQPAYSEKPERLNFKTYLQVIRNSVGSSMFRNYYVRSKDRGEFDALDDGGNSCAFYVSSVLVIFKKLSGVHGIIASTVKDLEASGWQVAKEVKPGDVIIWEAMDFPDGRHKHIGFCISENRTVSTSEKKKMVVEHDLYFGPTKRKVEKIYRAKDW